MQLNKITDTLARLWQPSTEAYILSPRFCRKHFNAKYKKLINEDDYKEYQVVSLMGVCEKCNKLTQVHYVSPMIKETQ